MRVFIAVIALAVLSLLLLSCGNGKSGDKSTDNGPPEPPVVHKGRPLVEWAEDLESEVAATRNLAVYELQELGPKASGAIPALVKALEHEDFYMKSASAKALALIGAKAVPELMKAIDDGRLHDDALEDMEELRDAGVPLVPSIFRRAVKAQEAGHEKTYWSACNALEAFGTAGFEYAAVQCKTGNEAAIVVAKYLFGQARTPEAVEIARKALEELETDD